MIDRLENQAELLERHVDVLEHVVGEGPVGIVALAKQTDREFHEIRYSLRRLEAESIIEPTTEGAVQTEVASAVLSEHGARLNDVIEQLDGMKNQF